MKKTLLFLTLAAFGLTASAAGININGQDYAVDTMVVKHSVGPGTQYAYYRLPQRPLEIHVLEVDLSNPYIKLEVWNGGQAAVATERPSDVGRRYEADGVDVVAVHNGDFYTTALNEVGISRMGLYGAGECIFNATGNPLFIIDDDGEPWIDIVRFNGTVKRPDNTTTRLHTVNQLRLEWEGNTHADQLSLYTPAFGPKMHMSSTGGTVAVLRPVAGSAIFRPNTNIEMEVVSVGANPGQAEIPADGALLHGVGASATFLDGVTPGQKLEIFLGSDMPSYPGHKNIREAIGGSGHIILRNGELCNIGNPDMHPRTFIGISKDRKTMYSVVIDGRYGGSAGISLDDQGRVLQWLGAYDGINLDGGGSSCMVVNGTIRNHNSDGTERSVGNGVIFYSTAPKSSAITSIALEPGDWRLPVGTSIAPRIFGFNEYGLLINKDVDNVTITCDPELGKIAEDGRTIILSDKPVNAKLYATTTDGLTTSATVYVTAAEASAPVTEYIIDKRKDYDIKLTASVGPHSYKVDASTVDWTSADTNVATVTNGRVRGVSNGTTTLTGTSGHYNGTITVTTENVDGTSRPVFFGVPAADLSVKQTGGTGITPEAFGSGFALKYTGNGTARGAYIQIGDAANNNIVTYGLPDAITIEVNPGDAPVNQIALNYADHIGNRGILQITTTPIPANTTTTLTVPFDKMLDVTDNAIYPITFSGLRFTMGTSAKNTEYRIEIPRFDFDYNAPGSVDNITVDNAADRDEDKTVYDLRGVPAGDNPAPGLYIQGSKKIIIRK